MSVHLPESWAAGTCREAPLVATDMKRSFNQQRSDSWIRRRRTLRALRHGTKASCSPKAAAEAERDLGYPDSVAVGSSNPGTRLFNLAIDSKLRGRDLVALRVHDVVQGSHIAGGAIVMQKKT